MNQVDRVVRNSVFVAAAVGAGGVLQLVTMLVAARGLGVEEFGTYSVLLAFAWVFQQLADFGLTDIIVRELATRRDAEQSAYAQARGLIWAISIPALALALAFIALRPWSFETRLLAALMSLATITLFHSASYAAVIKAREEMHFTAAGYFAHKVLLLAGIAGVLITGIGLRGVIFTHLAANLALCGWYALVVRWRYFRPRLAVNLAAWRELIVHALPLGAGEGLRSASSQIDVLLLRNLRDSTAVGLFNAPLRLVQAPMLLPIYLAPTLFPMFSRLAMEARDSFAAACGTAIRAFLLIGLPAAATCFLCSEVLVTQLLGKQFAAAAPGLRWLALALPATFLNALVPYLFTALREQRLYFWVSAGGLVLRVALNLLLVPRFGYLGACFAVLGSECAVLLAAFRLLKVRLPELAVFAAIVRPLAATAALVAVLWFGRGADVITLGFVIAAALAAYAAVAFFLGAVSRAEWQIITSAFGKRRRAVA